MLPPRPKPVAAVPGTSIMVEVRRTCVLIGDKCTVWSSHGEMPPPGPKPVAVVPGTSIIVEVRRTCVLSGDGRNPQHSVVLGWGDVAAGAETYCGTARN